MKASTPDKEGTGWFAYSVPKMSRFERYGVNDLERLYKYVNEYAARTTGALWDVRGAFHLLGSFLFIHAALRHRLENYQIVLGAVFLVFAITGWVLSASYHTRADRLPSAPVAWVPKWLIAASARLVDASELERPGINLAGGLEHFNTAFFFTLAAVVRFDDAALVIALISCVSMVAEATVWPGWYNAIVPWQNWIERLGQSFYPWFALIYFVVTPMWFGGPWYGKFGFTQLWVLALGVLPFVYLRIQEHSLRSTASWLNAQEAAILMLIANQAHGMLTNSIAAMYTLGREIKAGVEARDPSEPLSEGLVNDVAALVVNTDQTQTFFDFVIQGWRSGSSQIKWWTVCVDTLRANSDHKLVTFDAPPDDDILADLAEETAATIRNLFLNLGANAIRHGGSQVNVSLKIREADDGSQTYQIAVWDSGDFTADEFRKERQNIFSNLYSIDTAIADLPRGKFWLIRRDGGTLITAEYTRTSNWINQVKEVTLRQRRDRQVYAGDISR